MKDHAVEMKVGRRELIEEEIARMGRNSSGESIPVGKFGGELADDRLIEYEGAEFRPFVYRANRMRTRAAANIKHRAIN